MEPGVTIGAIVSATATVWVQVEALLHGSAACQVRVIRRGQLPLVTVVRTVMITLVPVQPSTAVGGSKLQIEPHSTVLLVAQVMAGAIVSTWVTIWVHVLLLEQASVACQTRVATKLFPQVTFVEVLRIVRVIWPGLLQLSLRIGTVK